MSQAANTGANLLWSAAPAGATAQERERVLRRLGWLARLLDDAYSIPGTRFRLGWDSLLGFIPFVGDGATTLLSAYFIWEAHRLGLPNLTIFKMLGNVALDFLIGIVPFVGDLFDVAWKANRRNYRLLHEALGTARP